MEMACSLAFLPLLLLSPLLLPITTHCLSPQPPTPSCPIDLSYVLTIPFDPTSCLTTTNHTLCCQSLLSLLGVGISQRLRETSLFGLPDAPTSSACLSSLQSLLTSTFSIPSAVLSSCFPSPDFYVVNNNSCAGITTTQDWSRRLGGTQALNVSCSSSLANTLCNACFTAVFEISTQLSKLDGNASRTTECFYFTILYATGVLNAPGPTDLDTMDCLLGVPLLPPQLRGSSGGSQRRRVLVVVSVSAAAALMLASLLLGFWLYRRRRVGPSIDGRRYRRPNTGAVWYTIEELRRATDDFSEKKLVGRGGFGVVYKGVLSDGNAVAVKKILESEHIDGEAEFRNEVEIISSLRHRNLVSLRGCCITEDADGGKQRYLVYDYMPNGSLHDHLYKRNPLTWRQRKTIILDIARGLTYLHQGIRPAIIHRDIKPNNVLLDDEMRAAVADFGLAKRSKEQGGSASFLVASNVAGTHGYLAPEYALYGHLSNKIDVYGFGVMVLEIMSGRRALEASDGEEPMIVAEWAREMVKAGRVGDVLDEWMVQRCHEATLAMERFVTVGLLCSHWTASMRPTMADALRMLEGDMVL